MKLVLLPGMDGMGELFGPLLACFPPEIEAITVAYPHDRALDHDELVAYVLTRLPDEPFALLAESFSGPIAMRIAGSSPQHLRGLILAASFISSPIPRLLRPLTVFAPILFRLPIPVPLLSFFTLGASKHPLRSALSEAVAMVSPAVMAARLRQLANLQIGETVASCQAPVVYLQATRDRLVRKRCLQDLIELLPTTTVHRLEGPHLILQTRPKAASATIQACLARFEPTDF